MSIVLPNRILVHGSLPRAVNVRDILTTRGIACFRVLKNADTYCPMPGGAIKSAQLAPGLSVNSAPAVVLMLVDTAAFRRFTSSHAGAVTIFAVDGKTVFRGSIPTIENGGALEIAFDNSKQARELAGKLAAGPLPARVIALDQ